MADLRADLLDTFHNSLTDLEDNRAGRLSQNQVTRLLASGTKNLVGAFVVGLTLVGILLFVAHKPLAPVQWILGLVLFLVVLSAGLLYFQKTRRAAKTRTVECFQGTITIRMVGRAGWYLFVDQKSFKLPVRPWTVAPGLVYKVYVSPEAEVIVGVEPADA